MEQKIGEGKKRFKKGGEQAGSSGGCLKRGGGWKPLTNYVVFVLIDVQYLQNDFLSFEKGSNGQIYSSSASNYPIKNPPSKISHSPIPSTLLGKPCTDKLLKQKVHFEG